MSMDDLNSRLALLEDALKLDAFTSFSMNAYEKVMIHRSNLMVSLLTLILDEVSK